MGTRTPVSGGYVDRFAEGVRTNVSRSTLLLVPTLLFLVTFFLVPFLLLIRMSLYEETPVGAYAEGTWTLDNFVTLLTSDFVHGVAATTATLAVVATAIVVVLGTFYAYAMWRSSGFVRTALLTAMILPLLTTLVVKLYAWVLLLAPAGTVNATLIRLPWIVEPLPLLNSNFGAIVGMVYITLPYAALPIYAVIETTNEEVLEAARDLGAGKVRSVWEVVIPQALPGILVAAVVCWAWNFGAYAAPALLGGGPQRTLAIEAEHQLFTRFNWSRAAALSVLMLVVVLVSVALLVKLLERQGGGIDDVL